MAFSDLVTQADRAALAAFGEVVTYTPTVGSPPPAPATPTGVFDAQYVLASSTGSQAGVEALGPAVFLLLADLPTDPEVDQPTLTIRGVVYNVVERRPDGMGGIVLALRTAS